MKIGASQNILLSKQSNKFLDGLILAENKLSKNKVQDTLILNIERQSENAKHDTLILSYKDLDGKFNPDDIVIKIKDLPKKKKKIEKFFLNSLKKLQPKKLRKQTIHPETSKKQDKEVLKLAKANYIVDKDGYDDFTCA